MKNTERKLIKAIWIILGTLSLFLGVLGIFIPGLPTTPFLLLTAALYVKSSERLYHRLVNNRFLGAYILNYRRRGGMTLIQKLSSLGVMWFMVSLSCIYMIESTTIIYLVLGVALIGTIVMAFVVKTVDK
ncbi:MAG: YbaN family protein [Bacteroidales bacterium]